LKTSNLILDFEFDQHLASHKHVINIIMWFRDMGCYTKRFRCYGIFMIDVTSEFCFWAEQRQTDLHVWVSDWPKLRKSQIQNW
jgi:hypothetical protein